MDFVADPVADPLWESLVREDETATFFQTPAWLALGARWSPGATVAPLLFDFPEGPACLPLLRDRRWGRDRYFSPFGTYSALVCPRVLDAVEIARVEASLRRLNIHLASSPFTRNPVRVGRAIAASTRVLDLREVDPENPMAGWKTDQRWRARAAERDGLVVRQAATPEDWDAYAALYEKSLERWGDAVSSRYPPDFFRDLRDSLPENRVRLWLAERGGRAGAGFLAFYHNRHAALWHGAADEEFFGAGANQLLYLAMSEDARARGFSVLDLLPSGGHAGVEAFKARFGSRRIDFESSLNRIGLVGALAGWKDRLRPGRGKAR
jgi:hypothetical protein